MIPVRPSDDELSLWYIMTDPAGCDSAEFLWQDPEKEDGCFRCHSYQIPWWRSREERQIDLAARDVGKTLGIAARCFNFAFRRPGQQRALVAPELNHLNLLIGAVEHRLLSSWLTRQMLRPGNKAFTHRPFEAVFLNGSQIEGRIPQRDGKGFKGCVAEGTPVLTARGYIPAEQVVVGDLVLTHTGSWKPVTDVLLDTNDCLEITGQSSYPITVSANHLIYGAANLATKKQKRRLEPLGWHYAKNLLDEQVYWATPRRIKPLPFPALTSKIEEWSKDDGFWWLIGRYVAEGYLSSWKGLQHRVSWVCTPENAVGVTDRLTALGIKWSQKERDFSSADVIEVCSKELYEFCEPFGRRSNTKTIPAWILGREIGNHVFSGYITGNGTWCDERNRIEIGSASKELILMVKLLAQQQGFTTNVSKVQPKQTHIRGVELKNKPQISWKLQVGNGNPVNLDSHFVSVVKSVVPVGERTVVDIVVAEDHSYVAESIVQHNLHAVELEADECFPAGTLVLTKRGQIPIEDVEVEDQVLTHKRRWKRVNSVSSKERPTVLLKGNGHFGMVASENHPFYGCKVQKAYAVHPLDNAPLETAINVTLGPEWIPAKDMSDCYWSSPTSFPQEKWIPAFRKPGSNGRIPCDQKCDLFFWMVGLYLSEGSYSPEASQITFSVHDDEAPDVRMRLEALGLHTFQNASKDHCTRVVVCSRVLGDWLQKHCGKGAHNKEIPYWALGLKTSYRIALLGGVFYGDACELGPQGVQFDPELHGEDHDGSVLKLTTVSKKLAVSSKLLALTLGCTGRMYWCDTSKREVLIKGRPINSKGFYQVVISDNGRSFSKDYVRYTLVRSVTSTGKVETCYDLGVDEDHSFLADGMIVHNSQDLPELAWKELVETVKRSLKDFRFLVHGVTRGVHDTFYRFTMPDSGYYVHRVVAMHRPSWTEKERQQKIQEYGGYDSPDFKRNCLGQHGDESSPIFTLAALMACVDDDEMSQYNAIEYRRINITGEEVGPEEDAILSKLDFPAIHLQPGRYERFWLGQDVGATIHPSEILVFGEYKKKTRDEDSTLRLLLRVHMMRVKTPHQAEALRWLIAQYRPTVFAMDSTGVGLPIVQQLQVWAEREALDPAFAELHRETERALSTIKGYNFSAKVPVGVQEPYTDSDGVEHEEELLMRNVQNAATDMLRTLVDGGRLELPWDKDMIGQFQGQVFTNTKSSLDMYGKRSYSLGTFHCLTGDSIITTSRGEIPIAEVVVNDQVMTRQGWKPVLDSWMTNPAADIVELELMRGTTLCGTAEHQIMTDAGWVALGDITHRHSISVDGGWASVYSVTPLSTPEPVYDLTVADAHEFYANGILVHNCLDAARMAAIAYSNYKLEEMLRLRTKAEKPAEIFLSFLE